MNDKFFDLQREKQDRVINAGLKVFARNGYRHATTDDIVKEAGISKGLLFHYFGNKVGVYVFLMDYSVRFLLLELSRAVSQEVEDIFELSRQMEWGKLQVLRIYPYMQAFLDKAFEENCLEALEECEEQKNVYLAKMTEYYDKVSGQQLKNGGSAKQVWQLLRYVMKGLTSESVAQDIVQPELMYEQICGYLKLLEGVFTDEA